MTEIPVDDLPAVLAMHPADYWTAVHTAAAMKAERRRARYRAARDARLQPDTTTEGMTMAKTELEVLTDRVDALERALTNAGRELTFDGVPDSLAQIDRVLGNAGRHLLFDTPEQ